jgi:hypothetical protein
MNEIKNFVNPNSLPNMVCHPPSTSDFFILDEGCECDVFEMKYHVKKVSAFQSGTGQAGFITVPIFCCAECGKKLDLK